MSEHRGSYFGGSFALIVVLFILLVIIGVLFADCGFC
ncbi:YjcZ family sporulation protein [Pseudogracilibacillus auburnensis]|uniref:Uncharacterized protein (TIGR01732 family) n=1 Tax=Pseudogracilibacillus auburnensis TaxID=1494959 RepID=A0A2V3W412_9BACI|nr:YjcZ family sporulation protein [Pseudogracilibacillus auburnensis]MBO1002900.1 YjcZ family sporulation protein [Pseudogracilibacillus auburnensis]PXW86995.1 uncharacterized protein (TIGR01732 family) [Pseudogracilibacillus auburnensis]